MPAFPVEPDIPPLMGRHDDAMNVAQYRAGRHRTQLWEFGLSIPIALESDPYPPDPHTTPTSSVRRTPFAPDLRSFPASRHLRIISASGRPSILLSSQAT